MGKIGVCVFVFPSNVTQQHSFIVGTTQGGLSPPIGIIPINEEECTFTQFRPIVELYDDRGMTRRSILFQEFLQQAECAPNPHEWPSEALQTYWFGYFSSADQQIPQIISTSEENKRMCEYINMKTTKKTGFAILIPQSQIGPVCGKCCQGCNECPSVSVQQLDENS